MVVAQGPDRSTREGASLVADNTATDSSAVAVFQAEVPRGQPVFEVRRYVGEDFGEFLLGAVHEGGIVYVQLNFYLHFVPLIYGYEHGAG